jgi:membrane protein
VTEAPAAGPTEQPRPAGRRQRIEGRLKETPALDPVLSVLARDRQLGGSLLAGALAYRLFGVLLPLALLVAVGLGTAASADSGAPGEIGSSVGISEATLESVAESSKLASGEAWAVGIFAAFALIYASIKAVRAVHAVHCLAWYGQVRPLAHQLRAGFGMVVALIAIALIWAAVGRGRAELGEGALAVSLLALIPFFAVWLVASLRLPHAGAPARALVPGALLVAAGLEAIQLATTLVVAEQVERASETYGSLGVAFAILIWLFVVSRVMVGSAMLNAALWERRRREEAV